MTAQTTVDPVIAVALARLDAASEAMVALQSAIEAGEPWPLAERFGTEPEAHWGPREVLAHCEEMLPYWMGEIERIMDGPEPAPYGRIQEDAVRIGIIERDRSLPIRELIARIAAGTARYDRTAFYSVLVNPDSDTRTGTLVRSTARPSRSSRTRRTPAPRPTSPAGWAEPSRRPASPSRSPRGRQPGGRC